MDFKNDGQVILNDPCPVDAPITIIVLGIPRSGTSMVAGVLHHLGIFMGKTSGPPVFEDLLLSHALEDKENGDPQKAVERYNAAHQIWGWKRPSSVNYLNTYMHLFRNPVFICPFKDLLSTTRRNMLSMGIDFMSNMNGNIVLHQRMMKIIATHKRPSLLFSYESAMRDVPKFVGDVCQFLKYKATPTQRAAAVAFVERDPAVYLAKSNIYGVVNK